MEKANILVVEDESIVAIDIEECLQSIGYNVVGVAASGEQAIELALSNKPDLVLMDIMLQGKIDGIGAASRIKEQLSVPVVFLTAHADKATLDRAKITEPYGYVLKPFKEVELRTVIEIALHRHSMETKRKEEDAKSAAAKTRPAVPDFASMIDAQSRRSEQDQVGILSFLRKVDLFRELGEEFLRSASQVCHFGLYAAGDVIALEGDEATAGFLVVYGRVSLLKTSASGKDLIVELLAPLDPFGLMATIERGPYPFSAKAQVDSRILWVPKVIITYILDNYPDVARDFFQKVLLRLRKAHDLSRALAHDLVEIRIASALLALVPKFCAQGDDRFEVKMTRQELAELTGTTCETVSRVVKTMERDGLLDLSESGKVSIVNMRGLEGIVTA